MPAIWFSSNHGTDAWAPHNIINFLLVVCSFLGLWINQAYIYICMPSTWSLRHSNPTLPKSWGLSMCPKRIDVHEAAQLRLNQPIMGLWGVANQEEDENKHKDIIFLCLVWHLLRFNWAQILEMIRKILHSNSFPSWSCIIIYNYFNNWQLPDSLWLNACANLLAEYSARKLGIYGKERYASLCLLYKETFTGVTKDHGIVWNGINLKA